MWGNHYSSLLNSSKDTSSKDFVINTINSSISNISDFSVSDLMDGVKNLKDSKASVNLCAEHLKNAHESIFVISSMLFNTMILHNFLPESMMNTIIVPILKDKNGDIQDCDNYRPLALTCIFSKLFEFVILHRYRDLFNTSCNQFGFKQNISTDMCFLALKETISYYKCNNTPIFSCFLDASKAFDKVNHWHLFKKLLDRKLPCIIVRILIYLYSYQSLSVRWGGCFSTPFRVQNGVPQGRILSPSFFNLYMDGLSLRLNCTRLGCSMYDRLINHLFYADDAVILATSPYVLQKLLNICAQYADEF